MRHPAETSIALYAGGDLSFLDRIHVAWHLKKCDRCRGQVAGYRSSRELLRDECGKMPEGLEWDRLAAEMTGNIRVGLAAGECVSDGKVARPFSLPWKPAVAMLGLTVMVTSAWWLNVPTERRQTLTHNIQRLWNRDARQAFEPGMFLEANRAGIQVKENGSTFTLMHPDAKPTLISVSTQGAMGARYMDADTGQVTITNVYGQ